jgi:glycosyltransferase involved in cell wall biosynthesis
MRITILQGAFLPVPPLMGGAVEKIWFEMGKQFAAQGHEVTQVSRKHPALPDEEVIDGVRHVRVKGYDTPGGMVRLKMLDLLYTLRASRVLPKADIVVTNTFWAPLVLAKKCGRIYVSVERFPKGQMRWYGRAARLRVPSTAVLEAVIGELGAAGRSRVSLIPNPLPFSIPAKDEEEIRPKESVILYAGRVHPEKGLDVLMAALQRPELQRFWGEWRVEIVGPWSVSGGGGGEAYLKRLQAMAANLPVVIRGAVNDPAQLALHYQRAAVFVYPSVAERGESFGLAPLEAMAYGVVPIVSDLACFKDFIQDQVNGLVFDHRNGKGPEALASALSHLLKEAPNRQLLSQRATQVRESHAMKRIAGKLLKDFEALL